jgi:hypothetical protein
LRPGRTHEGAGVDVALDDHAGERRGDAQVGFHVTDGSGRLSCGVDAALCCLHLAGRGFCGLLRDHHVITSDHARRGGSRLKFLERRPGRIAGGASGREGGLGRLSLGFRFGPLGDNLGSFENRQDLPGRDPRSTVNDYRLDKAGHPRMDVDSLVGTQFARQRQLHLERAFDDLDHIDGAARCSGCVDGRRGAASS